MIFFNILVLILILNFKIFAANISCESILKGATSSEHHILVSKKIIEDFLKIKELNTHLNYLENLFYKNKLNITEDGTYKESYEIIFKANSITKLQFEKSDNFLELKWATKHSTLIETIPVKSVNYQITQIKILLITVSTFHRKQNLSEFLLATQLIQYPQLNMIEADYAYTNLKVFIHSYKKFKDMDEKLRVIEAAKQTPLSKSLAKFGFYPYYVEFDPQGLGLLPSIQYRKLD